MKRILYAITMVCLIAVSMGVLQAQEAVPAVRTISIESKASIVKLSPDDHTLAVYNNYIIYDEAPSAETIPIQLIDLESGKTLGTLSGYSDWVTDVAFASDGSKLVSMHRNGDLILWDVATRKMIKTIQTYALGGSLIQFLNHDQTILMRSSEFVLMTLDLESGAITHLFERHIDTYQEFADEAAQYPKRGDLGLAAFAASPDGHWLAASTQNDEVLVWDMQSGKLVKLRAPSEHYALFSIRSFTFSPDSDQLAYFDQSDQKMHVWDIANQTEQGTYAGGGVDFAIAPDRNHLAWADRDTQSVYLADASSTDAPVKLVELPETQRIAPMMTSLAFTSDGKQLVVGGLHTAEGQNEIYVINLEA